MKTLEEVIKAMEVCMSGESCAKVGCPYFEEDCLKHGMEKDAIHYLNEYNSILDEYHELKDWWAEEYVENDPLSWEQLKTMKDKPVWIEIEYGEGIDPWKGWDIVDSVYDSILLTYLGDYERHGFGKIWKAYKKERK